MAKPGNCYQRVFKFALLFGDEWQICHGICTGQGKIAGVRFGHAWLENADLVFDPYTAAHRKETYYRVGEVTDVKRYTLLTASRAMLVHGTYGPWDPIVAAAAHSNTPTKSSRTRR